MTDEIDFERRSCVGNAVECVRGGVYDDDKDKTRYNRVISPSTHTQTHKQWGGRVSVRSADPLLLS